MSKTLSLKKAIESLGAVPVETTLDAAQEKVGIPTYTAAQLRAMLAELEPNGVTLDPTMNLPIAPTDPAELAAKAALPPESERKVGAAPQLPPAAHGSFSLNGVPIFAPQVLLGESVNPATGLPYVQVGMRPKTMISPPPTKRFDGR